VQVLRTIAPFEHSWVDRDVGSMEDASLLHPDSGGVSGGLAFTVDFITPIVDDPWSFGAIAAANSISDVYAMGGTPQVALSICGFPDDRVSKETLARILQGGRDKAAEAGCAIVGGHTVLDPELKYGLCVLGSVDPARALRQTGARPGDRLVLTKPIGTGIAAQAIKKDKLGAADLERAVECMTTLNRDACEAALAAGSRAATDVTGFGLLGHLHNLMIGSGCAARLEAAAVPVFEFARALAREGIVPGGTRRNLGFVAEHARFDDAVSEPDRLLLADAQTSGGLLIAVAADAEAALVRDLRARGTLAAATIGEVVAGAAGAIEVVAG
jgi:selenide,water dikinase